MNETNQPQSNVFTKLAEDLASAQVHEIENFATLLSKVVEACNKESEIKNHCFFYLTKIGKIEEFHRYLYEQCESRDREE